MAQISQNQSKKSLVKRGQGVDLWWEIWNWLQKSWERSRCIWKNWGRWLWMTRDSCSPPLLFSEMAWNSSSWLCTNYGSQATTLAVFHCPEGNKSCFNCLISDYKSLILLGLLSIRSVDFIYFLMHNWQSTVEEYKGSSIEQPFLSHKLNDLLNGNHEKSKTFQDLKTNLPHIYRWFKFLAKNM